MGRSSTVELRFLVPAVGGSSPSVPAPKNIALQALMNLERFFVGKRRDSNPQGCGAEETRSVFQRSTQGAKRRSGARPPTRRTRNPSVPHQPRAPHVKQIEPTPPSGGIRTRKERSDAAGRGRRRQTRCRHLGTLLSAGIIGTSPSAGSGLFSRTLRRTVAKKRQI